MSDETTCAFVSSRGLLKSCKIRPNPPISSCATNTQYLKDFIVNQERYEIKYRDVSSKLDCIVKKTDNVFPVSIYVCCDALNMFIREIMPFIRIPFYLVCGDGDLTVFKEAVSHPNHFLMLVLCPYLHGFFSQNMDISVCRDFLIDKITKLWFAKAAAMRDENQMKIPTTLQEAISFYTGKLRQIPIGMDYHTIYTNPNHRWRDRRFDKDGNVIGTSPKEQESIMVEIRRTMRPFYKREFKIYSNVMLCPDRYDDRATAVSTIPKRLLEQQTQFLPRTGTWLNMANYSFVLSPFGNGMDCHRTWEALLCGCIPIVRTSVFRELFYGLPVLIVEEWCDITFELLTKTIQEFKEKHDNNEFQYERLQLSYYTKLFAAASN